MNEFKYEIGNSIPIIAPGSCDIKILIDEIEANNIQSVRWSLRDNNYKLEIKELVLGAEFNMTQVTKIKLLFEAGGKQFCKLFCVKFIKENCTINVETLVIERVIYFNIINYPLFKEVV